MRIRRQAAARLQLTTEVLQLLLGQTALKKGPRVHPGRGMSLEVHNVAVAGFGTGPPEVIECDLVEVCGGGKSRNVAADPGFLFISADNHCHSIPAHQTLDPPLHLLAAGKRRLLANGNGV